MTVAAWPPEKLLVLTGADAVDKPNAGTRKPVANRCCAELLWADDVGLFAAELLETLQAVEAAEDVCVDVAAG